MRIELTESEKNYVKKHDADMDCSLTIFLARLLNKPIEEMEELAEGVEQAVQDYYTGESR